MIRQAGQDGHGPVHLFRQHDAYQSVRPGLRAESQGKCRLSPQVRIQAVSATDQKGDTPFAAILVFFQTLGDGARRQLFAAFIAGNQDAVAVECSTNGFGLGGLELRR